MGIKKLRQMARDRVKDSQFKKGDRVLLAPPDGVAGGSVPARVLTARRPTVFVKTAMRSSVAGWQYHVETDDGVKVWAVEARLSLLPEEPKDAHHGARSGGGQVRKTPARRKR